MVPSHNALVYGVEELNEFIRGNKSGKRGGRDAKENGSPIKWKAVHKKAFKT